MKAVLASLKDYNSSCRSPSSLCQSQVNSVVTKAQTALSSTSSGGTDCSSSSINLNDIATGRHRLTWRLCQHTSDTDTSSNAAHSAHIFCFTVQVCGNLRRGVGKCFQ